MLQVKSSTFIWGIKKQLCLTKTASKYTELVYLEQEHDDGMENGDL